MDLQALVRALGREAALQRAARSSATDEAPDIANNGPLSIHRIYITCLQAVLVFHTISLRKGDPGAEFLW